MKPGDWFYEVVRYVYEHGLMKGIDDAMFCPGGFTTRGMVVTILWNLEGRPTTAGSTPFTDVPDDAYCVQVVKWASENSIVTGYENGEFRPSDPVKREQMAAILFNYAKLKGYDVSGYEDMNFSRFSDHTELSAYALPAMQWCAGSGVIAGKGSGVLDPEGNATRGQTAKMLYCFCENIAG